ncbi:hypothetical protein My1_025 [Pectobacterium phage My1]|uniref:Uncharacterized protein n=1 Tax=Pectobacterium phage My1 TaxID=1204539 RepID=J9QKX7_9CAUD|nr:hypothetical protein My1_025 [Pectobacterium phage My1]AFQ22184.1 hypothetical protein My1_025 [Pectobacterium phage My1]
MNIELRHVSVIGNYVHIEVPHNEFALARTALKFTNTEGTVEPSEWYAKFLEAAEIFGVKKVETELLLNNLKINGFTLVDVYLLGPTGGISLTNDPAPFLWPPRREEVIKPFQWPSKYPGHWNGTGIEYLQKVVCTTTGAA